MKLIDLMTSPWAIEPASLREVCAIYRLHVRGEKADIPAIEARLGQTLAYEQRPYEVIDGVAVLTLEGVMAPKANLLMQVSGGISTQLAQRELRAAARDPAVRSAILAFDSPGGSAIGAPEFAQAVAYFRAQKPLLTWSDGQLASAAYWAAVASDGIYISGSTVMTGSLGVVLTHVDTSKADEAAGEVVTEITAGRYKRIASQHRPLSPEGRASLQDQADYVYGLLVDDVAAYRGTTVDVVLDRMADGRTFIGAQAIAAGLVDGVATLDQLIAELSASGTRRRVIPRSAGVALAPASHLMPGGAMPQEQTPSLTPAPLTRETLERDHPDLFGTLRTEWLAAGALAERERIRAVREQLLPGHESLIDRLAADGHSTGGDAAAAVLAAERLTRAAALAAHAADAPPAVPTSPAPAPFEAKDRAAQLAEAKAYAAAHGVGFIAALKQLGLA